MKKTPKPFNDCRHSNLFLKMTKLLIVLLLFSVNTVYSASAHSQTANLSLNVKNVTLDKLFTEIENSTEYVFFYKKDILNGERISVKADNKNLEEILNSILLPRNMNYHIKGKQIIVVKNELSEQALSEQQQKPSHRVKGRILDYAGEPLIGVSIVQKGTTAGTLTDVEGHFSINLPDENSILVISYIGYVTQEVAVKGKPELNITLNESTAALEEVVVIGYGVVKKKDLTGSVGQLSSERTKDLKVSDATQVMAGQIAGVQIQQIGGAPGQGATIRVRGSGSISASSSPLYVVDGYPLGDQNLNSVNPSDIESIEVLKDASAAAIYGSRAANGVVLVTTKSGKAGKVNVNLDMYYGFQNVTKKMDMLDAQEFAMFSKEAFNNNYVDRVAGAKASDPLTSRPAGNRYRYPAIYDDTTAMAAIGAGTDWQDEIFRSAPIQNYQLTVTGGDQKTKYMFSGGYFGQDGIVIGSDFNRFSARAKIDTDFNKWLKVGVNLAPSYMNSSKVGRGHWASDGVVNAALATSAIVPVYKADGTYASQAMYAVAGDGLTGVPNAVALANGIKDENTNLRLFGNMYAEISLMNNLKVRTTLGADFKEWRNDYFRPSTVPKNGVEAPLPSTDRKATAEAYEIFNWLNENTISYSGTFGRHELDAVAGFTLQKNKYTQNKSEGSDFPDDIIQTINNAKVKTGSSDINEWSMVSYLARVNYRFNNRYYLTASIRSDGSSRFGKNNRYGYFPSGSVAWRISQEDFMKEIKWIDDLKIRASFGLTGNNNIGNYNAIGTMSTQNYVFGAGTGNVVTGAAQKSISNADLTWEKTKQFDAGIELNVLKNRLSFVVDVYKRITTDLLLNVDIPTITGFKNAWRNIGEMNNKGLEFGINSVNVMNKDFTWSTNFNISTNTNKVVKLGPTGDPIQSDGGAGTTHITMIGEAIGSFYGYKQIGVYMNAQDLANSPHMSDSHVGDVKFADIDGSGSIDANDRTIIGSNMPDFEWGMMNQVTYKGFDLSVLIQGVQGRDVLHLGKRFYTQMEGNQNQMRTVLNRWQSESNPGDGWTPRANSLTTGQNNVVSSRWVEDASFIRINNLTLGYTLPFKLASKLSMQRARVYMSIQNLATITDYSGYNPETSFQEDSVLAPGTDYGAYPLARSFTFGVNVTF